MLDIFLLCAKIMKKLYCMIWFYPILSLFSQVQTGGLTFEKMYFYQDTLYQDSIKKFDIQVVCKNKNIRFVRYQAPEYIKVDLPASVLEQGKKYSIPMYVSASRIKKIGHFQTLVKLYTNEEKENEKILYVSGIVRPFLKKYSPQELANLPQIKLDAVEKNIGTIKKGNTVSVPFLITNTGNAPLHILNVKTECGCTHWQTDTTAILSKQQRTIFFNVDTHDLTLIHSEVWLWTNAANTPELKLLIKGQVKE
jgi:hypothetical protein